MAESVTSQAQELRTLECTTASISANMSLLLDYFGLAGVTDKGGDRVLVAETARQDRRGPRRG